MKCLYPASGNLAKGSHDTDSGAYQLILVLTRPVIIVVGALGEHAFPAGSYIYTGRASKGLSKRIARHGRAEKKLRWHIDYLLQDAQIEEIQIYPGKAEEECSINSKTLQAVHGVFPVRGFGSSDCQCTSHLVLATSKFPTQRGT
jgi:Uri superfamily endonuclease